MVARKWQKTQKLNQILEIIFFLFFSDRTPIIALMFRLLFTSLAAPYLIKLPLVWQTKFCNTISHSVLFFSLCALASASKSICQRWIGAHKAAGYWKNLQSKQKPKLWNFSVIPYIIGSAFNNDLIFHCCIASSLWWMLMMHPCLKFSHDIKHLTHTWILGFNSHWWILSSLLPLCFTAAEKRWFSKGHNSLDHRMFYNIQMTVCSRACLQH